MRFFRDRSRVFSSLGQPILFWVLFAAALRNSQFVARDLDLPAYDATLPGAPRDPDLVEALAGRYNLGSPLERLRAALAG